MDHASRTAVRDPSLQSRIIRRLPLVYSEGGSDSADRPPFVLAASGLTTLGAYLFVVQDNANWVAIVHPDETVTALPLPRGPSGARVFSKDRQNSGDKMDLEACVVMSDPDGQLLVAFGSGTSESSCWILRVTGPDRATTAAGADSDGYHAEFLDAGPFYRSLREDPHFCGGNLNIEGAIAVEKDRILLLQRGNAPPQDGEAVNATGEIPWPALKAHLEDPSSIPPPPIEKVTRYQLGEFDGVGLTFSDAEYLGEGRILYSASAEDPESGAVAGSVLGLIEPSGEARWAEIIGEDGELFKSKIEGLSRTPGDSAKIRFVIDDDDETAPSQIFEAQFEHACVLG